MTNKKNGRNFLLDLDEGDLRDALAQSSHLKILTGSPAKIKELLCILHGLAEERAQEDAALFPNAQKENTARHSQSRLKKENGGVTFSQGVTQANIISFDFGFDIDTQFFGLYAAGRPDLFLYVPPAKKQPTKTEHLVLDLTAAGYLRKPLWSAGHFDGEHIKKDSHGDPLLLSVEDQGLFLNGQFQSFQTTFPTQTLAQFSKRYVCAAALRPFVHDGTQFLYRGDPRRNSKLLRLSHE